MAVRKEGWTEIELKVKGGIKKGDFVRVWAGGNVDWGDADQPGQNVAPPSGPAITLDAHQCQNLALSRDPNHAHAVLLKTDTAGPTKCLASGRAVQLPLNKDNDRLWVGFNDLRGEYKDNHLGKGRRHEFDPLWVRVEVLRIIVD